LLDKNGNKPVRLIVFEPWMEISTLSNVSIIL